MKNKCLTAFRVVAFIAIFVVLTLLIQCVMKPTFELDVNRERALRGFDSLNDNTLDVLFVGTSTMMYGIQPMELYKDRNIKGYNLGSINQRIECSYYMVKYAFESQSPKYVFLDVGNLIYKKYSSQRLNATWRALLDAMPFDSIKIEMAKEYDKMDFGNGFLSAVFPLYNYHSRWSELKREDFDIFDTAKPYCMGGAWGNTGTSPAPITIEQSNQLASGMIYRNEGYVNYIVDEKLQSNPINGLLYDIQYFEGAEECLLDIKDLCESHGAKLILIKVPSVWYPQNYAGWTVEKYDKIKALSSKYELPYYDLVYDYPNVVDWTADSFDGGMHLNSIGAQKTTVWVGNLLNTLGCAGTGTDSVYDEMLSNYNKLSKVAMMQQQTEFSAYFDTLAKSVDDWTVFIVSREEFTTGMTSEDYEVIKKALGVQLIADSEYANSYVAIIDRGHLVYEATSNRKIQYETNLDGIPVSLLSSGWYVNSDGSIELFDKETAKGGRGLNIVVFDRASGLIIDSVSIDTYLQNKPISRNAQKQIDYFSNYLFSVC